MSQSLSEKMKYLALDEQYLVVTAIDFGTTFSGYAFSFRSRPNDIKMNKNWGSELNCESYKTPTCVMTKPDGSFHSFGYKAEHEYSQLDPDEDKIGGPDGYNLYRHFKMMLHGREVNLRSNVVSTSGHASKAIDIFTMALHYMYEHMMEPLKKALKSPPKISDIRWVLTVPAIWSDESKRFMREAAHRAGLIPEQNSSKLMFALEPEAASIFCRSLEIDNFTTEQTHSRDNLKIKSGEKMLILDAGGGTVDITVHEVQLNGNVKEICPPSGGPWGGIRVEEKFISLMAKIFGTDFINFFRSKQPQQWLEFMTAFERAKKSLVDDAKSSIKAQLPYSFGSELLSFKKATVSAMVKQSGEKNVSFNSGYFTVKNEKAKEFFIAPISETIAHVQKLIQESSKLAGLNYVLLVGGFAESKFLQEACKRAFSGLVKVLVPMEAQLAIVKGAILFGHNPLHIESRIARYTYGTDSFARFDETRHDPTRKKIDKDNEVLCEGVFDVFITKDQETKTGSVIKKTYETITKSQRRMAFSMYKIDSANVKYVDDLGVIFLGKAKLESPDGPLGSVIEARITFGHTEIIIEARDTSRGEDFPLKLTIDFLAE